MGGGIIFAIFCYGLSSLTIHTVVKLEYFSKNGYFFILLAGAILSIFYEKRYWLQTMFWWGVLGDILVSIMTHYDTQWCYALPAFIATGVMLFDSSLLKKEYLKRTSIALLLFFEVFAKDIIQITNTDHYGGTVFNQEYCYIRHGPAKWVWARSVDAEKYNEIYSWIRKNISRETKVCYFGKNVLLYLMSEHIDIAVPQLFMDYADDTILGQYYNTYPEQMPDLVIYDISPTSKVIASENEKNIFHSYNKIYSSCNYEIYIR